MKPRSSFLTARLVLQGVLTLFASLSLLAAASAAQKNVLIFFIDDLRPDLGCYGSELVKSPAIDALAAEGTLFERAYCQQALCAPSRISMMTGQYPDRTGICGLFTPLTKENPKAMTLPRYFKEQGYLTASFGKVYHHQRDDQPSWSELPEITRDKYASPATLTAIKNRIREAQAKGLSQGEIQIAGKGPAIEIAAVKDEAYRDGQVAQQAIASLRQNKEKPFFMCVGFAKPHLPFAAPKRYWDLYQREQFTVPARDLPEGAPTLSYTSWNELRGYSGIPEEGALSDELTAELRHGYAASVSFADAQVGKVMAELDRLNLRQDTIVVLWGDHGYKLGEYGLWCKHTNLELDARVPLIISAPGQRKGQRTKALTEIVDLFPSVVELSGGKVPAGRDGKNLTALLSDPTAQVRPFALTQYQRGSIMGYSLRNDRYRYTEWIKSPSGEVVATELYDHQETSTPMKNLVGDEKHANLVAKLSKQLDSARRVKASKVYQAKQ